MIKVQVRGLEDVQQFLGSVPHGTKKLAIAEITTYLLGDNQHGLKYYPENKRIKRASVYGNPFSSDKQRRWFFWALRSGQIHVPYHRTGRLRTYWHSEGGDYQKRLVNKLSYAGYVQGDSDQSKYFGATNWRKTSKIIADNMKGAMLRANQAIQRWIKAKNK